MTSLASGLSVALAAGGEPAELAAHGLGIEHVNELMVRLAMALLRDGHRLAFGGTLGDSKQQLTKYLIDVATNWVGEKTAKQCDVTLPETWPLVNYSAWPFYSSISEEEMAKQVGICRFVTVDPPDNPGHDLIKLAENWRQNPLARLLMANSLTAMRELCTVETDLRVVWGGQIARAAGWMAGILEEIGFSLKHGKPLLVLGGFGGCARLVADFLAAPKAPWPHQLSLEASANAERDALLSEAGHNALKRRFNFIQKALAKYRDKIHSQTRVNQISTKHIRAALTTDTPREAIKLATAAASKCRRKSR